MSLILIVDDDVDMVNLTKLYLADQGHEVLAVTNPFDADEILERYRINLAIVDINMPVKNGFDFVTQLKRSLRNRFVPIIFMSSRHDKKDIDRAASLHVEGYLVKPFDKKTFVEKVNSVIANTKGNMAALDFADLSGSKIKAQVQVQYEAKIKTINEIGLTIETNQYLGEVDKEMDNTIHLESPLWGMIGIPSLALKITGKNLDPLTGKHTYQVVFRNISPEALDLLKKFIKKR